MTYDPNDDLIIRQGNLRQWLAYKVGTHNLRGWWIVTAVVTVFSLIAFGIGKLF